MTKRKGSVHTNNNMWSDDQRRDLSIYQAGSCLRLYIADDQESKDSAFNLRSPEDYHQITATLESHALALGWITETRATFESGALVTDKAISQQEAVVLLQREIAPGMTLREAITGEKRTVGTGPEIVGLIEGQHRMQDAVNSAADGLIAKLKADLETREAEVARLTQARIELDQIRLDLQSNLENAKEDAGAYREQLNALKAIVRRYNACDPVADVDEWNTVHEQMLAMSQEGYSERQKDIGHG